MATPTSVKVRRPRPPGNRDLRKVRGEYNVLAYALGVPINDGGTHPLSAVFGTGAPGLAAAQLVYPHAIAVTDELAWAATQAAINACRSTNGGNATGRVWVPAGTYRINQTLTKSRQLGLAVRGAGRYATNLTWTGAASGVMVALDGVRESELAGMQLTGDGSTTIGITINGNATQPMPATRNRFDDLVCQSHAYGLRIGQVAFQADQSEYHNCIFRNCATAGVSIEDANAVFHDFYDCLWSSCAVGIQGVGTGGHFSLTTSGFQLGTGWDIIVAQSSRPYVFTNVWSESGTHFLNTAAGTLKTQVVLDGCNVNGFSDTGQMMIQFGTSGSLVIVGGNYQSAQTGLPAKIKVGSTNNRRANITVDGAIFDGDPFVGSTNIAQATVVVRAVQPDYAMDVTRPGNVDGPLSRGTFASPQLYSTALNWEGAAWLKIPSGTVLAAGINSYTGSSKNVQGSTRIAVTAIHSYGGLTTQFSSLSARDDDASVDKQFKIDVLVSAGFTLTSDLIFHVRFEPEFMRY